MNLFVVSRLLCTFPLCIVLAIVPAVAAAQSYPNRPVKLIVPYAPGGVTDIAARLVAQKLSGALGQQVVVDNKPGAGARIGAEAVARSPADGYTLLYANSITHGTLPATSKALSYDPIKDFAPVAQLVWYASTLVCHPSVPANNVAELIALARKQPRVLSYASAGPGSGNHFSGELFNAMAGVDMLHVPYKGSGPAMQDVMAGTVSCTHEGAAKQYVDGGRVKALATTGAQRDPRFPNLPTVEEGGLKGYNMTWWQGIVAPAGTPPEILVRLVQAAQSVANDAEFKAKAYDIGLNVKAGSPAQLARVIADDIEKFRQIAAGAKLALE